MVKTFQCPQGLRIVVDGVVEAVCPFTGAPDYYDLEIEYSPRGMCIEAISLAEWLDTFKGTRISQEELASVIASRLKEIVDPEYVCVRLAGSHGRLNLSVEVCLEGSGGISTM